MSRQHFERGLKVGLGRRRRCVSRRKMVAQVREAELLTAAQLLMFGLTPDQLPQGLSASDLKLEKRRTSSKNTVR